MVLEATETFAIVVTALILVGIPVGSYIYESWLEYNRKAAQPQEIVIFAWAHENGGWKPNKIVVKKDVPIKIVVKAMDTAHSLVIPDFGIDTGPIQPGHEAVVTFTPTKAGTFIFFCGIVCSSLHTFMIGELIVEG